ncbi:uncharacterized protein LOC115316446 [Ixodes scapularis]|uniref:uncharacterized protein LOC115316446 n=1 Tax=Ixodes scapularis TaxID=6945 RepID=UPI001AA00056|nr:uncharacterized protein LOC115316446 [Ixodes scapularis]
MKTALICALFGILFFGSQCSSEEETHHKPKSKEEQYKRHYQNYTGLCGSWYRNESSLESIYNCTLEALDKKGYTIVNKTWEEFRHNRSLTITALVGLMCNLSTVMPYEFYLMFELEHLDQEPLERSDKDSVSAEAQQVPPKELFYAEGNCSEKIHELTPLAPTIPSEPAVEAIE